MSIPRPTYVFALKFVLFAVSAGLVLISLEDTYTNAILISLAALVCGHIYQIFVYPFYFSPLRHLPEPQGGKFPWAHAAILGKVANGEAYKHWVNSIPNDGLIRFRVLLNQERILLSSPAAVREVLVTKCYDFDKDFQSNSLVREILGNGLLLASGEEHKRQKKIMQPAFQYRHIKDLYPVFWSKALESVDCIYSEGCKLPGSKTPQFASDWTARVSLDIIGLAGMGHDFNSIQDPGNELFKTHKILVKERPFFRWMALGFYVPIYWFFKLPIPLASKKQTRDAAKVLRDVARDLIDEKNKDGQFGSDILSVAMKSGGFTNDELVNQMMTFLAAGHETTAVALTWLVYHLGKNLDIQRKLCRELQTVIPRNGKSFTKVERLSRLVERNVALPDYNKEFDPLELDRLPYLNAVVNEILRFEPAVPKIIRVAQNDVEICGTMIPKGTTVMMSVNGMNTNKDLWGDDSMEFKPERWLNEHGEASNSGGAVSNYANMTFIHGPRGCIGKDFARSEILCVVAAWYRRYTIALVNADDEPKRTGYLSTRPADGLEVNFFPVTEPGTNSNC
ncbi:cytochrome P450 [Microthyrium microscopicum]|uniref:Cytochrome P450 n=1 Tax=Microthyrium microscopicum TaxID=703497 RepID=A0A6A6UKS8_9PEZI|nr:cytochrome P450 [Microthyrium microscopicum]